MGDVWLVKETYFNIKYALKSPQINGNNIENVDDFIKRFYREARSWIMLPPHPNVVSCFYFAKINGVPQILLEYVDGFDLLKLISTDKNMIGDWRIILSIAIQIADGMAHAHKNGLIHRDLTPKNIMITDGNSESRKAGLFAMITDFGIAKKMVEDLVNTDKDKMDNTNNTNTNNNSISINRNPNRNQIQFSENMASSFKDNNNNNKYVENFTSNQIIGNWPYISPERWSQPSNVKKEADIYSFGIVLFELITGGTRPYKSESDIQNAHPGINDVLYRMMHREEKMQDIMRSDKIVLHNLILLFLNVFKRIQIIDFMTLIPL